MGQLSTGLFWKSEGIPLSFSGGLEVLGDFPQMRGLLSEELDSWCPPCWFISNRTGYLCIFTGLSHSSSQSTPSPVEIWPITLLFSLGGPQAAKLQNHQGSREAMCSTFGGSHRVSRLIWQ